MTDDFNSAFPKPSADGREYDPDGYKRISDFRSTVVGIYIFGGIIIVLMLIAAFGSDGFPMGLIIVGIIFAVIMLIVSLVYKSSFDDHEKKVADKKSRNLKEMEQTIKNTNDKIKETNMALTEHKDILETIQRAHRMGDVIIQGNHAPVIIDSTVTNSFNSINQRDPDLASAIKTLGGFIETSGENEAADSFRELHGQLAQESPNKTIVRALWEGIVSSLPAVKQLTDVVKAIQRVFQ